MARSPGWLDAVRPGILTWLENMRDRSGPWGRWPYHQRMERPWALISSALAVRLLALLGELDRLPAAHRSELVNCLQDCQDPADGWFKDPLVGEAEKEGPHSWPDIHGQMLAGAEALQCLGVAPRWPLPSRFDEDLGTLDPAAWAASMDWSNPWHMGERFARAIQAWLRRHGSLDSNSDTPPTGRPLRPSGPAWEAAVAHIRPAMGWVTRELIDPATGLPSRRCPNDLSTAMAGTFKLWFAWRDSGLAWPYPERAMDTILTLQHADGDWGFRNNMCLVWDALWVLREFAHETRWCHRGDDIRAAGARTGRALLDIYRKTDGGFAFNGALCLANHHSIRLSRERYPIGDMLGTLMSVLCFQYLDEWGVPAEHRQD